MPWPSAPERRSRPPVDPPVIVLSLIAAIIVILAYKNGYLDKSDLMYFAMLIPSIIVHEVSHGALALRFGDRTAQLAGRLTLNPLRHVDVWGTFVIPAVLLIGSQGSMAFGYAKPVPVNTSGMTRNQTMWTGLIGPIVNIVIAGIAALVINVLFNGGVSASSLEWVYWLGVANVVLAVFNLIPIPPLDGAAVVERFLPAQYWEGYLKFRQYSMVLLLVIVLVFNQALGYLFNPALDFWESLLS